MPLTAGQRRHGRGRLAGQRLQRAVVQVDVRRLALGRGPLRAPRPQRLAGPLHDLGRHGLAPARHGREGGGPGPPEARRAGTAGAPARTTGPRRRPGPRCRIAGAGRTGRRASVHSSFSSARNGDGTSPPTTCTDTEPRVRPTWKTRRSSSMSTARRWGSRPADTSCSTTWGHSRPLTRWTVDSTTPSTAPGWRNDRLEPVLETLGLGVQGGQGHQGVEVVGLSRAVQAPARSLQQFHSPVKADVVAHGPQDGGGRACRRPPVKHPEVRDEAHDLVAVPGVEPQGQPFQPAHARLLAHPLDHFGGQARDGRRAASDTSVPARCSGDDTARRSQASAAWTAAPRQVGHIDGGPYGDLAVDQGHLDRGQRGVDPGQDGHVPRGGAVGHQVRHPVDGGGQGFRPSPPRAQPRHEPGRGRPRCVWSPGAGYG